MKKLMICMTVILFSITLMGCKKNDPLTQFINSANNNVVAIQSFEAVVVEDEQSISALVSNHSLKLSLTASTNQEKIAYIRTLFSEIKLQYANNVIKANDVKIDWQTLKSNAESFLALDLELEVEHKTDIIQARRSLIEQRTTILETHGMIYRLFSELRGKYNEDNLDLIINNLEQIKDILMQRATYIAFVHDTITDVNLLIENYLF